jgi:ABC-type lipoprotein export system ATPase subunit
MQNKSVYSIKNLQFEYTLGSTKFAALKDLSVDIPEAKLVCLAGPSGSGKTTLLSLLGLIENVQLGEVFFLGKNLKTCTEKEKTQLRRFEIGFVFQNFLLFDALSGVENVEYFLASQGVASQERKSRAEHSLELVGLKDQMHKTPLMMSGGQRQRVAIARALAKNPKVIIADEPTASLDQDNGKVVMQIFRDLVEKQKVCVVFSSHDEMAQKYAHHRLQLKDGLLVSQGAQA